MKTITLTQWDLNTLRCAAAAGSSFKAASEEIGHGHCTVRNALRRMGLHEEFKARFEAGRAMHYQVRTDGRIQVLDLATIQKRPPRLPETPQSQWLARPWRTAA